VLCQQTQKVIFPLIAVENYQLKVAVVIAAINPTATYWRRTAVFMVTAACSALLAPAFQRKTDA